MKRTFDILFSSCALCLLLPVFLAISIAIKLSDEGPIFFRQKRIGLYDIPFFLYKFKSMRVVINADKGRFDLGDASRVTKIGAFLRRTKLDELPQLINVLKGEMSLVGPRPEIEEWVRVYPERWTHIHTVRPGITDPASLLFRNEEKLLARSVEPEVLYREKILPRKLDLYEQYVQKHSLLGDMMILFKTLYVVLCK